MDLSQLPEPMRREVAWCVFRIIELGGKIPTPGLSLLVCWLGEAIGQSAGRGAGLLARTARAGTGANRSSVRRTAAASGPPAATTMNKHPPGC